MEQLKAIQGDYARMDGNISELKNQVDIIGDVKNSSDQCNPKWVLGDDRGLSSMHKNCGKSLPPKRASSASPDRKSGLVSIAKSRGILLGGVHIKHHLGWVLVNGRPQAGRR